MTILGMQGVLKSYKVWGDFVWDVLVWVVGVLMIMTICEIRDEDEDMSKTSNRRELKLGPPVMCNLQEIAQPVIRTPDMGVEAFKP